MVDDKVPANPHPADEFEDMYSIEVISVWLCIWILAVGLSRYARHRSNKHGETAWARWALMPAYERVLMLKKLCIVAMAVDWLCQHYWPPAHSTARWSASNAARYLAHTLYVWTYSVVVVALCAHSGGSKTLWRAMCTMLVGTVITATLMWFEWGYYWNAPDGPHMVSW